VRASFTLENTGNGDLSFLDVAFPDEKTFGRKNLRVQVNGRDTAPSKLPEEYRQESPGTLRISLDPTWTRKEKRELQIEYSLSSPEDSGSRIALDDSSFHLAYRGWYPVLQPPKHVLSPFPKRPDKTLVTILAPENFFVLSRGTPTGRKSAQGEMERRFLLRKNDLAPYVVSGRYAESSANHDANSAIFWTLQPLKDDPAQAAARIAGLWNTLQTQFGPLEKNSRPAYIVESAELRSPLAGEEGPAAASFPGGALVNSQALALGIGSDEFIELVARALARNWFGEEIYPGGDASLGMGQGLPEYATIVMEEARGGEAARRERILKFLRAYDDARDHATENSLGVTTLSDPAAQQQIARAKAPLFYAALEDAYGEAAVRAGLKDLVSLLRGQEAGYDDLRAALEQSTGKNLAEPFRVWLYGKGIPGDFRARYESAGANARKSRSKFRAGASHDCIAKFTPGGIMKEIISTEKGPKPIGPYSQAVRANGFIFISGQGALDPATGKLAEGGTAQQTERALENLKAIVEAAGSSLDQAVKASVFLKDMNDFDAMNKVYARYFPKNQPARTTVEVARLPLDIRVEIELIALA